MVNITLCCIYTNQIINICLDCYCSWAVVTKQLHDCLKESRLCFLPKLTLQCTTNIHLYPTIYLIVIIGYNFRWHQWNPQVEKLAVMIPSTHCPINLFICIFSTSTIIHSNVLWSALGFYSIFIFLIKRLGESRELKLNILHCTLQDFF